MRSHHIRSLIFLAILLTIFASLFFNGRTADFISISNPPAYKPSEDPTTGHLHPATRHTADYMQVDGIVELY